MGKKRPSSRGRAKGKSKTPAPGVKRSAHDVGLRRASGGKGWVLVHPRCALERADDLVEVRLMIEAGEHDIASDELHWLLGGCSNFIAAHRILAEIALIANDIQLARGHFGIAFHLGVKAAKGMTVSIPHEHQENRDFLKSGKGLLRCLRELEHDHLANDLVVQMLQFDPNDRLGIKKM